MQNYDIIILGAGPAGLMCGQVAGARGLKTLIIDQASRPGGKLPISGGGKGNFTNMDCSADDFYSENPHFVKSALARFSQWDTMTLLEENGISWETREHGRLFCLHSANEIVNLLCDLCLRNTVEIKLNSPFEKVEKNKSGFTITAGGQTYICGKLVVACGSCAWPQCGATSIGYDIARQFGHAIVTPRPALVPLIYNKSDNAAMAELTGNSVSATVTCGSKSFSEEILFTHHGLSGPAILQISCLWPQNGDIFIDWLNGFDLLAEIEKNRLNNGSVNIAKLLLGHLPRKFIQIWQDRYFNDSPIANLSAEQIKNAAESLNNWHFQPAGNAGLGKAEAAAGGVATDAISSKSMASKLTPGLCFIGEVLDVTGALGGYNLQWAFSSGFCCGQEL